MTGIVSSQADQLALGADDLLWGGLGALVGVVGALGFRHLGYLSTVPLAVLPVVLALVPAIDDTTATVRRWTGR